MKPILLVQSSTFNDDTVSLGYNPGLSKAIVFWKL